MAARGHILFDTAIGRCGLAWGPLGLLAVQLPEADDDATEQRLLKSTGDCPALSDVPSMASQAVLGIQAMLQGEARNLLELPLDMSRLTDFQRKVYALARAIPPGSTRTYGEVALELGDVKLARAVGQAMGHNPFAPVVPCHRVLAAGNQPGGFSATGGAATKLRMLAIEGAMRSENLPLFR
jgi:methylated-DNA-[protein]-cysteine S-methyltransferase